MAAAAIAVDGVIPLSAPAAASDGDLLSTQGFRTYAVRWGSSTALYSHRCCSRVS
ncbi:MAG: hypothetical protein ACLSUW_06665 [Akkermansia sp.]